MTTGNSTAQVDDSNEQRKTGAESMGSCNEEEMLDMDSDPLPPHQHQHQHQEEQHYQCDRSNNTLLSPFTPYLSEQSG
jgi:hypothetical protein